MKKSGSIRVKISRKWLVLASVLAVVVLIFAVAWAEHSKSTNIATITPATSPTPTVTNNGTAADAAKGQYASPTPSPAASSSPTATPTPSANYINSFTVTTRTDGFHVATVLSPITSGTCQVTISPTNSSVVSKSGTVVLSGTTYMCDFGGDILGSGTSGSAKLTVTGSDGTVATQGTNF